MPKSVHEHLAQLLRADPSVLAHLLPDLPASAWIPASEALGEAPPVELRADTVFLGDGVAVIVDIQTAIDHDKRYAWPAYATSVRRRRRCKVLLVVLALNRDVARWAGREIKLDLNGSTFRPRVIGPDQIPTDALDLPTQVLAALAHGREQQGVVERVLRSLSEVDNDTRTTYVDLVYAHLGPIADAALEALMQQESEDTPESRVRALLERVSRRVGFKEGFKEGQEEGRQKGQEEGRMEGRVEGRVEGREEGREEGLRKASASLLRRLGRGEEVPGLDGLELADLEARYEALLDELLPAR
jgi:hypothetical protein